MWSVSRGCGDPLGRGMSSCKLRAVRRYHWRLSWRVGRDTGSRGNHRRVILHFSLGSRGQLVYKTSGSDALGVADSAYAAPSVGDDRWTIPQADLDYSTPNASVDLSKTADDQQGNLRGRRSSTVNAWPVRLEWADNTSRTRTMPSSHPPFRLGPDT